MKYEFNCPWINIERRMKAIVQKFVNYVRTASYIDDRFHSTKFNQGNDSCDISATELYLSENITIRLELNEVF